MVSNVWLDVPTGEERVFRNPFQTPYRCVAWFTIGETFTIRQKIWFADECWWRNGAKMLHYGSLGFKHRTLSW